MTSQKTDKRGQLAERNAAISGLAKLALFFGHWFHSAGFWKSARFLDVRSDQTTRPTFFFSRKRGALHLSVTRVGRPARGRTAGS
jgi:hypothetical protein